ncbi:hypothetical protein JCM10135_01130 [Stetteria hydrogenophila]
MAFDPVQAVGVAGVILVFASFIVKDWRWLYSFNMSGALLLAVYAYLTGSTVFLVVESGLAVYLAYRLYAELSSRRSRGERRERSA